MRVDSNTDKHTDTVTAILNTSHPYWGDVTKVALPS